MKLNKRGWIVLVIIPAIVATLFLTWATRDVCYVGEGGNFLGYGSCTQMIDEGIGGNK